jgi:hypothetical protein
MMSLEAIRYVNQQIGARAAQEGLVPYVPFNADETDYYPPFPFPHLGYYQPDDWERTEAHWFIDKTGWGREEEPALTA